MILSYNHIPVRLTQDQISRDFLPICLNQQQKSDSGRLSEVACLVVGGTRLALNAGKGYGVDLCDWGG